MADDGGPFSRTPSESSEAPTSAGEASDTGGLCARAPTAAQVWDYPLSQPEKHRRLELLLDGEARLATEVIRFMCSKAYIVTAIESEAFCPAAARAFGVVAEEVGAIGALDVATWVLSIGGVITISGLGSYLTWFLLRCAPALADAQSEYFVPDPEAVTGVAAVVCVLVATSFMALFGMISDTIVFCWALDRQSEDRGGDYVPPRLRELLGDDGSDRASGSRRSLLG